MFLMAIDLVKLICAQVEDSLIMEIIFYYCGC